MPRERAVAIYPGVLYAALKRHGVEPESLFAEIGIARGGRRLAASTSAEVNSKIIDTLAAGPPSEAHIAASLAISNRTLQRRLQEEGTTFADLLRETRLQLARQYLGATSLSIVEISLRLGFTEPSSFSRAFKTWTGQRPGQYRTQLNA